MGDLRPLLCLGQAMTQAGHEVVSVVPRSLLHVAEKMQQSAVPWSASVEPLQDALNLGMVSDHSLYGSEERMSNLLAPFCGWFQSMFEDLCRHCKDADLLIGGPAQPLAKMVHEIYGIPFASVQFSHFGGSGGTGIASAGDRLINEIRRKLGLKPVKNALTTGANSDQLALYAFSRHLLRRPEHWPPHIHVTGFFFEIYDGTTPSDDLEDFFEQEQNPIAMTFGSMSTVAPMEIQDLLRDAVAEAGVPAVIQGVGNYFGRDRELPIYWCGYAPHSWLFRRSRCVVHHGGGGTFGAVMRAGIPSIFVPHGVAFDQHYWSLIAADYNLALEPIPIGELTSRRLARQIVDTLQSHAIVEACASIGKKIRLEDGVGTARRLVEDLVRRLS